MTQTLERERLLSGEATLPAETSVFQAMLDEHGPVVMGVLRRMCRNQHDAEDVFQETAIRVWRGLQARPDLRNPRAWLMKIAYRTFLDIRRSSIRRPNATPSELPEIEDECQLDPAAAAETAEQAQELKSALELLPEATREVLVLHYGGGLTLREVAAAMEITLGTVKSRLNRALEQMRKGL